MTGRRLLVLSSGSIQASIHARNAEDRLVGSVAPSVFPEADYLFGILDDAYEALAAGESGGMHYMGNDRRAPDFTVETRGGEPWKLSDHRGKVVVMNFWSITCRPCVQEMPTLVDLAELTEDRDDVEVVAISVDEGWEQVASIFPPDHQLTVAFDPDRSVVHDKFGTRLYPETWFIDPDGIIRVRVDGPRDWSSPIVLDLVETFM